GADFLQSVGVFRSALRLALAVAGARRIIGQRQTMLRTGNKWAEALDVIGKAAQRHAAEIDAVIGARPRYEAEALALAFRGEIAAGDLHRGIGGFPHPHTNRER